MQVSTPMLTLQQQVLACQKCDLANTRTNVVFGTGNEKARVVFVGEGPGEQEDLKGEPFVGRSGILLDKMLLAAGFSRTDNLYIANMVKCRPPNNRNPSAQEIEKCIVYLRKQIQIIQPEYIVCLGRVAAQSIIDPDFKVTKQHGEFVKKNGIWFMGTFHPSALLRNPNNKPQAFADLLALRDHMQANSPA